jgi:glycosyltransferase involved in cell wall biosynthesis
MSLDGAAVVVLPAWVEHWPRRLLAALAAGIPVIASRACGLKGVPGVTTIADLDGDTLQNALAEVSPCLSASERS